MKLKNIICLGLACMLTMVPISSQTYAATKTNEELQDENKKLKDALQNVQDALQKEREQNTSNTNSDYEKQQEEKKQKERDYNVGIEIIANVPTLTADTNGTITVNIKNVGGEHIEKGKVAMSYLPAGLSLVSGTSDTKNVKTVYVGKQESVNYNVTVSNDIKGGTYPVTFEFSGKYGTSVDNYKDYTYSKTFYVKILEKEKKEKDTTQYKPFVISNIKHPGVLNKGEVGNVEFTITNPNSKPMNSIKVTLAPEDGIANQSQNVFVENNFGAGASKSYSVKVFPKDGSEKKNYAIKITVEPTDSATDSSSESKNSNNGKEPTATSKILPTATQYTGIFYNAPPKEKEGENKIDGVKNPQIIISNYSYGDKNIEPNGHFPLTMTFVNTSSEKTLKNIKISLTADEGTFIAVGSANSFYIDSMTPGSSVTKTLNFAVKPDATTKTVGMTVDYTYEDEKANALTSKDMISIPVMQKTSFNVDDIAKPQDVMEGEPVNLSANFYNLGKTPISNLKVKATGDFTIQGDSSYFVGNLDSGKNDSFSVSVIPNDPKKLSGVITFTYETLDGKTNLLEKKFSFDMNPVPMDMQEDPNASDVPEKKSHKKEYIGGAIVVGVIALGVFLKKKNNKKKKLQELDLDE